MEKFGVTPDKVIDVQALAGDSTDNVPGVPGIGVKTAAQLINEYGDLETLLSARRRDQAAQAARGAAAECRAGAHLAQAGHAQGRRADAGRARGLRQEEARSQRAAAVAGAAGLQEPSGALHRRAGRGDGARRPGSAGRKTRPARAGDQAGTRGARQVEPALHRRRLRADHRRGGARRVDRRGHARRHGGLRLRDRCARRPQRRPGRRVARPARRPVGQRQLDQAARGLPAARPSQARRRGAGRARPCRRRRGQGRRRPAARPDPAQEGDRQAEAAARGPVGPQGRPEHQVRHVRVPPARHRGGAGRRHHAAVLRARCRQAQSRHGRAGQALSRPGHHQVLRRGRQRRQAGGLRQGADRQGARLRRRGRRRHHAAVGAVQAPARPRAHGRRLRDHRAAADPGAARHGAGRHQGRRAAAAGSCRPSSRSACSSSSSELHKLAGRPFNVGSPKQLGEILFDEQKLPGGRRNKNGSWATDVSILEDLAAQGHRAAGQDPGAPPDRQAQGHLHRRPGARARRQDRPRPYLLPDDRRGDRAGSPRPIPTCRTSRCAPRKAARSARPSSPSRATSCCRPTIRRSSCGCSPTWPTSPRSRRRSRAATTSTPSRRARCSACRSRAWTRWCAGAPRRSTSASSTASRPSAWPTSSASASRRRASTSPSTSSAIPASATTWRRPRSTRASTAT